MRINEILQTTKTENLTCSEPTPISKVYTAFVNVCGSVLVQSGLKPCVYTVYLDQKPIMDQIIDVEIIDVGVNPNVNEREWVVNFEICGLMTVAMDQYATAKFVHTLIRTATPVFEHGGCKYEVPDSTVSCKSMHIADFDQQRSIPIYRPDGH